MISSVVVADGLEFAFGEGQLRKQILFDIQMRIQSGEIVILTGHSGSGKTTLLTLLGALRQVSAGELTVLGHKLHKLSKKEAVLVRRKIGFIFQNHNLLDFLTAQQNVELVFQMFPEIDAKTAAEKSRKILTEVGLGEHLHHHPSKLSGGQKQRVAIARALVAEPQLILADEPTASLDGRSGREVVNMLQKLAREQGCPVLLVTHDSRILDIADRIIHIEDGRLFDKAKAEVGSSESGRAA